MLDRRSFLRYLAAAAAAGVMPRVAMAADDDLYAVGKFRQCPRLLHLTDTHAQLAPVYFREPSVNLGIGVDARTAAAYRRRALFSNISASCPAAAMRMRSLFSTIEEAAQRYGRMGGFAHLKTLVDRLRTDAGAGNSLLLDGGDLLQGSGQAQRVAGRRYGRGSEPARRRRHDRALGIHLRRSHAAPASRRFKGEFLAQNVFLTEDAAFNECRSIRIRRRAAYSNRPASRMSAACASRVIGQAFPYVPIAHPKRFTPDWTFGIHEQDLQKLVDDLRNVKHADAVVLLSHNGMDVDLKLASRVTGIDIILGGHTHDAVPRPVIVTNGGGKTVVTNAGSNGKFLAVLDLDVGKGALKDFRYHLLPVYADLIKPDPAMQALIDKLHAPYAAQFGETLTTADELLYRRGNFPVRWIR